MSLLLAPNYPQGSAPGVGAPALADETVEGLRRAQYQLGFDGWIYHNVARDVAWISPQVGMDTFECRATAVDLSPPPGTYDTWLDLANSWVWGWAASAGNDGSFLIEIRRKSDLVVVASATIQIIVDGVDRTGTGGVLP